MDDDHCDACGQEKGSEDFLFACMKRLKTTEAEIERLTRIIQDACEVLRHYDLPEHAFHYERVLAGEVPLTIAQANEQLMPVAKHDPRTGPCPTCGFVIRDIGRLPALPIDSE